MVGIPMAFIIILAIMHAHMVQGMVFTMMPWFQPSAMQTASNRKLTAVAITVNKRKQMIDVCFVFLVISCSIKFCMPYIIICSRRCIY